MRQAWTVCIHKSRFPEPCLSSPPRRRKAPGRRRYVSFSLSSVWQDCFSPSLYPPCASGLPCFSSALGNKKSITALFQAVMDYFEKYGRVLAEGKGFEPPDASRRQRFFKTAALSRSATRFPLMPLVKRTTSTERHKAERPIKVKWKQRRLPAARPPLFSLPSLAVPVEAFDFIKISYRFFTFF